MSVKPKLFLLSVAFTQLMLASPQPYANLGSSPVHTATAPINVAFSPGLTGTPASYQFHNGSDFSVDSSSCAFNNSYYRCNITFTPLHPGLRWDALSAYDSNGFFIGIEYVYGIGIGPLPVFSPGVVSTLYPAAGSGSNYVSGIVKDSAGNIFFSDEVYQTVSKLNTLGTVTVVAGTSGVSGSGGDGGPATNATLDVPKGLAFDAAGNLYIADYTNNRIRMVDTSGNISTFAGTGSTTSSGDGGLATAAGVPSPSAVAVDLQGNVYIAEGASNVIRMVDLSGNISKYAGTYGQANITGDNGPAASAGIGIPVSLAVDTSGNLYLGDLDNNVVRKIDSSATITTIAGIAGSTSYSGDGGPATSASIGVPKGIALDPAGNIYIADSANLSIRKIDTQGTISTIAGNGGITPVEGVPADQSGLWLPAAISIGDNGSIYVGGGNLHIISPTAASVVFPNTQVGASSATQTLHLFNLGNANQSMSQLAATGDFVVDSGSTCSVSAPLTNAPAGCSVALAFRPTQTGSRTGSVVVTSTLNAPLSGNGLPGPSANLGSSAVNQAAAPTTVAFQSVTGTPVTYQMAYGLDFSVDSSTCSSVSCQVTFTPHAPGLRQDAVLALDINGNVIGTEYVYAIGQGPLPVFSPGTISTKYEAGSGNSAGAYQIVKDPAGNLYFSNPSENTIRKMDTAGNVTVFAGTAGASGFSGDGGPATSAELFGPNGLAIDSAGNLYIADYGNHRIRMVDRNGVIQTIAGTGAQGSTGNGGAATAATLDRPLGLAVNLQGDLYISQQIPHLIRKVSGGIITAFAGNGAASVSGDGGPALSAAIGYVSTIATDAAGNLYVLDAQNSVIRKINRAGIITTIAGISGTFGGYTGDGNLATTEPLTDSLGLAVDPAGNIYFSDSDAGYIRKIDTAGIITTIAGNGTYNTPSGDGGPATLAGFNYPAGVVLGDDGSLYVADVNIRKISPTAALSFPATNVGSVSAAQTVQVFNIGNLNQNMSGLSLSSDFAFAPASTCVSTTPLTIAPTGCSAAIVFQPTQAGMRAGLLTVALSLTAPLTGNGIGVGSVSSSANAIAFGTVVNGSSSSAQILTITDSGSGALTVSSAVISGPNAADFTLVNNCTMSLSGGTSCTLSVVFTSSIAGTETATLTVTYAAAPGFTPVTLTIPLSGTGAAVPAPTPTAAVTGPLYFVPVAPCRLADTRVSGGAMDANGTRDFAIAGNPACGVPSNAAAFVINVTAVTEEASPVYLRAWASGESMPFSSISNLDNSSAVGHQSIVKAGANGSITLFTSAQVQVVLDVTGYFVSDATQATYHPLASCRAVDTRQSNGSLGGPSLEGQSTRTFSLAGTCGLPAGASSYVVNMTAVPDQTLGYLQAWSPSASQPATSILNSYAGNTVANTAIVQPHASGQLSVFATDKTDLVIDVQGYFGTDAGGLALYLVPACRVFDTRTSSNTNAFAGSAAIPIQNSSCNGNIAVDAQAYILNAAVLPQDGHLGYLTLWADGHSQPFTSTLNSSNGSDTSNMAVLPVTNGVIDAFTTDRSHLVLDFYGYFAAPPM